MPEFYTQWLADPFIQRFLFAFLGVFTVVLLSWFFRRSISRYVTGGDIRYRLRKVIKFVSYFAVLLVLFRAFSDSIGNLGVAMGVAGAGVAFALQEVIASFAGWFAITFAGFYKPGDRVELGGIRGDVIDISFLRTTLMEIGEWVGGDLYSGRVVRVANSFIFKEPVFNYSGEFPFLWDEISVPVKYSSDHNLARGILVAIAEEINGEYAKKAQVAWDDFSRHFLLEDALIEPRVTLVANDNWMEFTVRYVVDFKIRRRTKDRMFSKILDEFGKTGGKVQLASATIEIVEAPPLDIRLNEGMEKKA